MKKKLVNHVATNRKYFVRNAIFSHNLFRINERLLLTVTACFILCLLTNFLYATQITLLDYGINIDGVSAFPTQGDTLPDKVDTDSFDDNSGLGTISVTIAGMGDHFIGLFVDHEIDEGINTFFNETGMATGVPAAGQSWEIDEPGFGNGDIFINFTDSDNSLGSRLDNGIGVSVFGTTSFPDDMAMAMGWNVNLAANESVTVKFLLDTFVPSDFYLAHNDPDSSQSIYLSSSLSFKITPDAVPEPSTIILLSSGLIGIIALRKRQS